jgi:hypothetical protein
MAPFAAIPAGIAADRLMQLIARTPAAAEAGLVVPDLLLVVLVTRMGAAFRAAGSRTTMDKLAYVVTRTPPGATALKGWSAGVAFRKSTFYCGILYREIRPQVPQAAWAQLVAKLCDPVEGPTLVDFDADLRDPPADVVAAISDHYAPTGVGTLWRRRAVGK